MSVKTVLQQLADSGYAQLSGLHLTGAIPVDPALLNDLIRAFLSSENTPLPATFPASGKTGENIDMLLLLRKHLKKLEVQTQEGKIVLAFEIRID